METTDDEIKKMNEALKDIKNAIEEIKNTLWRILERVEEKQNSNNSNIR